MQANNNKRKVLFVLLGLGYAGAERVMEDYIDNSNNIDPYFLLCFYNKQIYDYLVLKYSNVYFSGLKYNDLIMKIWPIFYEDKLNTIIETISKENNIDVVFFNNSFEGALGYKYIKNHNNVVYEIHDIADYLIFHKRYLIKRSINKCENTITVSKACNNSWNNKIKYVVPNGLNPVQFKHTHKDYNFLKIIFIGRNTKNKGWPIFIKVANHFKNNHKLQFTMIFADSIPNLSFPKNVDVYKQLSRDEIINKLQDSSILLLPTNDDPFPTAILEAEFTGNIVLSHLSGG